jgi:hypothetical protein
MILNLLWLEKFDVYKVDLFHVILVKCKSEAKVPA